MKFFLAKYPNHRRTPAVMFGLANAQLENGNKLIANLFLDINILQEVIKKRSKTGPQARARSVD